MFFVENVLYTTKFHKFCVFVFIQKYHENGYLHLDIKPNNIFIFPETAQHIQLFDFDSVITIEELKQYLTKYMIMLTRTDKLLI